jgi:hypothetical protein
MRMQGEATNPKMLVHGHLAEALQDAENLAAFTNIGGPGNNADVDRTLREELRRSATDRHGDVECGGEAAEEEEAETA